MPRILPIKNLGRFIGKTLQQPCYAARVGWRRGKAYLSYALGSEKGPNPESLTLFLTRRCNLKCAMCGQRSGGTEEEPLSTEQVLRLVDDVASFTPHITLFGGEPLLHPGCVEIIRRIKAHGMHCLMITNGSTLDRHARELVEAGLDELNVSVDGGREVHDRIRGMAGLYDSILAGLKEVARLKEDKNARAPLVNLQCTVSRENCGHLAEVTETAREVNAASVTYHNLIFLREETLVEQRLVDETLGSSSEAWEGFVLDPEIDPDALDAELQEILAKRYPFGVDVYPNLSGDGLVEYYRRPTEVPGEYPARCISPWIVAYVFPDGEVRPCLNFSYSYGNIKGSGFSEVWNGEGAVRFRNILRESKMFPACTRCTELYRY